jgi:hypothetical protein|tara:strand:- start:503 stop:742 length:240 start_codon:yes stop_codon:yes gene_type:complete
VRDGPWALSKLLLREFFELLDATYTKISTLSSSFLHERAGETIASPSRLARQNTPLRDVSPPHTLKLLVTIFKGKMHHQ